jgi:hypothetical protein
MFFTDSFAEEAKHNPIKCTLEICERVLEVDSGYDGWGEDEQETYLEAFALISALINADLIELKPQISEPTGDPKKDCISIRDWLTKIQIECRAKSALAKLEAFQNKFNISIGRSFHYEFSQGDLDRVQTLINELRTQISESKLVDEHKQRLLARLEKMQAELHKKVSDLDRFWGVIGDAGVVIGKLGTDAKPIVDRLRELKDIIWSTQSRAEELPSGTNPPLLENKPDTGQGQIEA